MIRIAAVGDIHLGVDTHASFAESVEGVGGDADVLVLAGDLTRCGSPTEARLVRHALEGIGIPCVAVLGNHDHHDDRPLAVRRELERGGIRVLDGGTTRIEVCDTSVVIAGAKGFGGGFIGRCASPFGESEMKQFALHARDAAHRLAEALAADRGDVNVALTHYSPVTDTLQGEPPEIYPFLGSYLLAEAIDAHPPDLAFHGHAHQGVEHGRTAGGVRIRNVAMPVIRSTYKVYDVTTAATSPGRTRFGACPTGYELG